MRAWELLAAVTTTTTSTTTSTTTTAVTQAVGGQSGSSGDDAWALLLAALEELVAAIQEAERRKQAYRVARWSLRRRSAKRSMEEAILIAHEKSAQFDVDKKVSDEALAVMREIQAEAEGRLDESNQRMARIGRATTRRRGVALFYLFVLGLFALLSVISGRPWLPSERITLKGNTQLVAYVLDTDSDTITVLRNDDRRVVMFSANLVVRRTICEEREAGGDYPLTMIEVVFGRSKQPNYPLCV